jgi:hypothetical protein
MVVALELVFFGCVCINTLASRSNVLQRGSPNYVMMWQGQKSIDLWQVVP